MSCGASQLMLAFKVWTNHTSCIILIIVVYVLRGKFFILLLALGLARLELLLNFSDLVLNEVLVLLCGLSLGKVNLFAEAAAHTLVDVAVRANRVICEEEEQVDHTHVRI